MAYHNSLSGRMEELRFPAVRSPGDESAFSNGNGAGRGDNPYFTSPADSRSNLQRRFTADSSKMSMNRSSFGGAAYPPVNAQQVRPKVFTVHRIHKSPCAKFARTHVLLEEQKALNQICCPSSEDRATGLYLPLGCDCFCFPKPSSYLVLIIFGASEVVFASVWSLTSILSSRRSPPWKRFRRPSATHRNSSASSRCKNETYRWVQAKKSSRPSPPVSIDHHSLALSVSQPLLLSTTMVSTPIASRDLQECPITASCLLLAWAKEHLVQARSCRLVQRDCLAACTIKLRSLPPSQSQGLDVALTRKKTTQRSCLTFATLRGMWSHSLHRFFPLHLAFCSSHLKFDLQGFSRAFLLFTSRLVLLQAFFMRKSSFPSLPPPPTSAARTLD